ASAGLARADGGRSPARPAARAPAPPAARRPRTVPARAPRRALAKRASCLSQPIERAEHAVRLVMHLAAQVDVHTSQDLRHDLGAAAMPVQPDASVFGKADELARVPARRGEDAP